MRRKHFPKIKDAWCKFCKKDYKIKSKLEIHQKTCKKKNKLKVSQPGKKKSKKEKQILSIAEDISEKEQLERNQRNCGKKFKEEKKELPVWIMRNEKNDTSQIIVDISAKVHFA